MRRPAAVLAVDGGGTKTDIALVSRGGRVLAARRVAAAPFGPERHDRSMEVLRAGIAETAAAAGVAGPGPVAETGVFCLSGADLPVDDRRILPALRREGFVSETLLRNDTFAVLRAGTDRGWGIGVVCGTGLNCAGTTPEGRSVRFPALGALSGDILGGGGDLAVNAIGATIRARDGRGARTELERLIPEYFGLRSPAEVLEHVHVHRIAPRRVIELAPVVLQAADDGDSVAEGLVLQLADELVSMVSSAVRRLRLARREFDLVLGGGIVRANSTVFHQRVRSEALRCAPHACIRAVHDPPVVGAALLGLDRLDGRSAGSARAAAARLRTTLTIAGTT